MDKLDKIGISDMLINVKTFSDYFKVTKLFKANHFQFIKFSYMSMVKPKFAHLNCSQFLLS